LACADKAGLGALGLSLGLAIPKLGLQGLHLGLSGVQGLVGDDGVLD